VAKEQGSAAGGWRSGLQYQDPPSSRRIQRKRRNARGGLFVANTNRRHCSSSLTCTCKSRIFAQLAAVSAGEERKCPTFHFPSAVLLTSRYASRGRVRSSPKSCTPATAVDSGKYHPLDPQVVFSTHRIL
jgi:hypothetical protein